MCNGCQPLCLAFRAREGCWLLRWWWLLSVGDVQPLRLVFRAREGLAVGLVIVIVCVGFVTGTWVWVGWVRVRVRVPLGVPVVNPHPRGGFSGFYN